MRGIGQSSQPLRIGVRAYKGLEHAQRNPLMPVVVASRLTFAAQPVLKRLTGLAQVVQQRGQRGEQVNGLAAVPIVFILSAQHVALRGVRGHGALGVEAARIPHHPQQFAVI